MFTPVIPWSLESVTVETRIPQKRNALSCQMKPFAAYLSFLSTTQPPLRPAWPDSLSLQTTHDITGWLLGVVVLVAHLVCLCALGKISYRLKFDMFRTVDIPKNEFSVVGGNSSSHRIWYQSWKEFYQSLSLNSFCFHKETETRAAKWLGWTLWEPWSWEIWCHQWQREERERGGGGWGTKQAEHSCGRKWQ